MITIPPALVERPAVPYVARRGTVTMATIEAFLDDGIAAVEAWLRASGVEIAGSPIIRYLVLDLDGEMVIDACVPVADGVAVIGELPDGELPEGFVRDELPAGTYGCLTFADMAATRESNLALERWAEDNGVRWDSSPAEAGEAFACRYEVLMDDPEHNPDPTLWRTEVGILVARG